MHHFADRLIERLRVRQHPLCVGLDPHLGRIPDLFRQGSMAPEDPATADAVESFLEAIVDRAVSQVAIVKPQIALFERLGWRGLRMLERVVAHARALDLMVLLDAKRGDIGSTASAYAEAYLGVDAPLSVDAMTLNPYLGRDTLEPFLKASHDNGRGLFVLVKTSNSGSGDYQDRKIEGGGRPLFHEVAASLRESSEALRGAETGFSSLGVVVGATWPGESEQVRELLPASLFLVPGYGAQGASAKDAVRGFVRGPDGRLEGGLVNSSRGVLFPPGSATADTRRWEHSIDEGLERAVCELGEAVA